jgi:hypothetical membrane protein
MSILKNRTLINWLGLLGIASFVSYLLAVLIAPTAYPGYDWLSQAVSDLSAKDAPSRELWAQLSSIYTTGGIVCVTLACVYIQNRLNRTLRFGIYLFTLMNWISGIGYSLFPLSTSGYAGTFQDIMHVVVTAAVVGLSIVSLITIMVGGYRDKRYRPIAMLATISLSCMFIGAIGTGVIPKSYFGITERFSVFSATGFTAALGFLIFAGFDFMERNAKPQKEPHA